MQDSQIGSAGESLSPGVTFPDSENPCSCLFDNSPGILHSGMQGCKGIEPFRIIFNPPGVPLVVQKAGFGILPIPGEQGTDQCPLHPCRGSSESRRPIPGAWAPFAAKPIRANVFRLLPRKRLSDPENLGRVAMSVGINDHDAILAYDFHLIFRPGDFRSRGDQAGVRRLGAR